MTNSQKSSKDIMGTQQNDEALFVRTSSARIPTPEGDFTLYYFRNSLDHKEHLALVCGEVEGEHSVLVRVHSECFTGDVLRSKRCDCGAQLATAMHTIAAAGQGVILYLRQEGRGIGLEEKLKAYALQDEGYDTVDANLMLGHQADERDYTAASHMLQQLRVGSIRLITNNPAKIDALRSLGVQVVERVPCQTAPNIENIDYLQTKVVRMHHLLNLEHGGNGFLPVTGNSTGSDLVGNGGAVGQARHQNGGTVHHPQVTHSGLFRELAGRAAARHRRTGKPSVTLSYAQSLDGSIAAEPGQPTPISGGASLQWTHSLRAGHDAILIGVGTALADDPSLTVRLAEGTNPVPVVIDSTLRLPPTANLFDLHEQIWIATTEAADPGRRRALRKAGATVLVLPSTDSGRVDLIGLLEQLGQNGVRSLMVEGGAAVLSSFLEQGLAHTAIITIAPILLGGVQAVQTPLYRREDQSVHTPRLQNIRTFAAGQDIILWGDIHPVAQVADLSPPAENSA